MAVAGGFVAWERGREAVAQRTIAEERRAEAERNFDVRAKQSIRSFSSLRRASGIPKEYAER
jgi:hypothetical protein